MTLYHLHFFRDIREHTCELFPLGRFNITDRSVGIEDNGMTFRSTLPQYQGKSPRLLIHFSTTSPPKNAHVSGYSQLHDKDVLQAIHLYSHHRAVCVCQV